MTNLNGKNVLLGISGGIAAYKAAELTRLLVKQGANVRVCMTVSASEFITPLTMQALSGNPVHTDMFDPAAEAAMGHIELAKWAKLILIAPATANTIAKVANGFADNLLTTLILASEAELFISPAMNQVMWKNVRTCENMTKLKKQGVRLLGPDSGEQACGDVGFGRMLEPCDIIKQLRCETSNVLKGVIVLITAGPTREALDPVRYITNRSSGKMGYAIAKAATQLGAKVTLISGPVSLPAPHHVQTIQVESANDMFKEVKKQAAMADIFISSAAVADYAAATIATKKIKKTDDTNTLQLTLKKNPDILSEISHAHTDLFTVGFAAETNDVEKYARGKLISKKLDMIAANKVGKNKGFDQDDNALLVIWGEAHNEQTTLALMNKSKLAYRLLELIVERYNRFKP